MSLVRVAELTGTVSTGASQQGARSVVSEKLTVSDITGQHSVRGVTCLRSCFPGRYPGLGRARGEAGPQTVAGMVVSVKVVENG
jgi:hypothetical protein